MELGFLRMPVAFLAAVAVLAGGCSEMQRVAFSQPAGTTVLIDGRAGGVMPFEADLARDRAHALELRPSAETPAGLSEAPQAKSIKGLLVLPRRADDPAEFRVRAEDLNAALESGKVLRCDDARPEGIVLHFKGSTAGISPDDPEIICYLPQQGRGWLGDFSISGDDVAVAAAQVILLAFVVVIFAVVEAAIESPHGDRHSDRGRSRAHGGGKPGKKAGGRAGPRTHGADGSGKKR